MRVYSMTTSCWARAILRRCRLACTTARGLGWADGGLRKMMMGS
jgi:hypothetical protein